jgi:phage tail tape-measure protein
VQAQLAESESKLSQAKKLAAASTTEVQLARDSLAAAQRDRKEELAALRQQHEAAIEQVCAAAGCSIKTVPQLCFMMWCCVNPITQCTCWLTLRQRCV